MNHISKWLKKVLAGTLSAVMILSCVSPNHALAASQSVGADGQVNYLALGDSITAGDNTYVRHISSYLKNRFGICNTINWGISGWTSKDLANAVTDPSLESYSLIRYAMPHAEVVTIDIGSNDIYITTLQVIADCFGCTINELPAVGEAWAKKIENATGFMKYIYMMQAMNIANNIKSRLNEGVEMKAALNEYANNLNQIFEVLDEYGPDAKIYVGNIYNPFNGAADIYIGNMLILDVEEYTKMWTVKFNQVLAKTASKYKIVDLYNTINKPEYINGDIANGDYDPHPNQAGHTAIANKFIASMKTSLY